MTNQQISKIIYSLVKKQVDNSWQNLIDCEVELAKAIKEYEEYGHFDDEEVNKATDYLKHNKQVHCQWEEVLEFLVNKIIEQNA